MLFKIGYDKKTMEFSIDDNNFLDVLQPNKIHHTVTGIEEVKMALENPIHSKRLKDIVKPGERVAIITSDITRPMPSNIVLPLVIEELKQGGVNEKDITIVMALGSHRKHTETEKKHLVGEDIYTKIRCIDSDSRQCIHLGTCKHGTPVDIYEEVANADRRICLGNIEYHYFAGYSGGAKAIMPGVSTREAIQANHSNMVNPNARAGVLNGNPVREDIDQVGEYIPIDFILNVVLDSEKNIIKAVAGHYIQAHREGCKFLDTINKSKIKERADIVITTPGGFPKDINLYQAQKALDNAKHAVKDGGIIILVASCKEGLGEQVFERWLLEARKPETLVQKIKTKFELGGHKAAAIGMVLQHVRIFIVSDLDKHLVKEIFMEPFNDIQEAIDEAIKELGDDAKIIVMPSGGSTLPQVMK